MTSFKVAVIETNVFGCLAWNAKCIEPGCDFVGKRHSGKNGNTKAVKDAQQHGEQHMLDTCEQQRVSKEAL